MRDAGGENSERGRGEDILSALGDLWPGISYLRYKCTLTTAKDMAVPRAVPRPPFDSTIVKLQNQSCGTAVSHDVIVLPSVRVITQGMEHGRFLLSPQISLPPVQTRPSKPHKPQCSDWT